MKKSKQLGIIAIAALAIVSLTACSGHKKESATESKPRSEKTTSKKDSKKKSNQKKSGELVKDPSESVKKHTPIKAEPEKNTDQKIIQTKPEQPKVEVNHANRVVNTAEDAISLYAHFLAIGDGQGSFTAAPVDGGFVLTPTESAYGHAQTIIKYNGDAYNTNGQLIEKFATMAAPNNPNTPESGWHGY